jgi:hypothetical protein
MSFALVVFLPAVYQPTPGDLSLCPPRGARPIQRELWMFWSREAAEEFAASHRVDGFQAWIAAD